jgi:hypothetical protein
MNSVKITAGGFDKVVFESEIDTLAGGATIDPSGVSFTDGVIPAGTLVSVMESNGFVYPVKITNPGASATFDRTPLGFTASTVPIEENTLVGIVIEGVARKAALHADVQSSVAKLRTELPKITIV